MVFSFFTFWIEKTFTRKQSNVILIQKGGVTKEENMRQFEVVKEALDLLNKVEQAAN